MRTARHVPRPARKQTPNDSLLYEPLTHTELQTIQAKLDFFRWLAWCLRFPREQQIVRFLINASCRFAIFDTIIAIASEPITPSPAATNGDIVAPALHYCIARVLETTPRNRR
jgi:hypothetical protein